MRLVNKKKTAFGDSPLHRPTLSDYFSAWITPKVPARFPLGPAVKNNWFVLPFAPAPSPKSIPQSWSITMTLPFVSLTLPTNCPVNPSNPLMVPLSVLFEISSVLLNRPKFLGATAIPQGWFSGTPWSRCFPGLTGVPSSLNTSTKPPSPPATLANATYTNPLMSRMPNGANPDGSVASVKELTRLKFPSYISTLLFARSAAYKKFPDALFVIAKPVYTDPLDELFTATIA